MPDAVKIVKVDEELRFDDLGKEQIKMRVMFTVGAHGPFYRRYEKATFDATVVKNDLDAYARELAILTS